MSCDYLELTKYLGMQKLPGDFEEAYREYRVQMLAVGDTIAGMPVGALIDRAKFDSMLAPYRLPDGKRDYLDRALDAIEADPGALEFARFFVWNICFARSRHDVDGSTELKPGCLGQFGDAYAFLVLLSCVPVAEQEMRRRGIPVSYYEDIPHRMLREQMDRYIKTGRIDVEDIPWRLNFYTMHIFLLDRFLFIPYIHGDPFRLYRSNVAGKVLGISDGGLTVDSEGQLLGEEPEQKPAVGTGYEFSARKARRPEIFHTFLEEDETRITGYALNPCGYVTDRVVTLPKAEYEIALDKGDCLIALHVPGGEGYTPERLRGSMKLAVDFFDKYFPELKVKGFWSESWLYDPRLTLILEKDRNIPSVQRQMFRYSGGWDGGMLYVHLFRSLDTVLEDFECKTSLQRKAKEFLLNGNRFCASGMIFLREELETGNVYSTGEDEGQFLSLMKKNNIVRGDVP